jgi:formate-dependent nitrite reductase membrane component NrfD
MESTAMVWEWPIWLYLFAAGVAGGGFFATFLIHLFTGGKHKDLLKIATWIGVPLVGIGTLLLIVDLGNQLDFWHLVARFYPVSPMSIGTWVLILWAICAVALIVLWLAESEVRVFVILRGLVPLTKVLGWILVVLSAVLITYTGVLLSATSTAMWATVLLPVLFVVSAISTGLAATMLVAVLLGKEIPHRIGQAAAVLEVYEVVALIAFLIAVPAGVLISGPLSLWFWIGVIAIGMLIPFVLELVTWKTSPAVLVLAMAVCVLIGGVVLRAVVVVGGQI